MGLALPVSMLCSTIVVWPKSSEDDANISLKSLLVLQNFTIAGKSGNIALAY